jgi:hypothetical protein
MIKVNALPLKKSPFEDFILSEGIAVDSLSSMLSNEVQDGQISADATSIAHLVDDKLVFFIHQGSNNYSDLILKISNNTELLNVNYFLPKNISSSKNIISIVIPEKQTIFSKCNKFSPEFSKSYDLMIDHLNSQNEIKTLTFSEIFPNSKTHKDLTFFYDSHLTNYGSILAFEALTLRLGLNFNLDLINWHPRTFKPDLLNKFLDVELTVPWVAEGNLVDEFPAEPGRNRGLIRQYSCTNEFAIKKKCLIVGDSHSYSGIAAIASNFFAELTFVWENPLKLDNLFLEPLLANSDYVIYELSERFLCPMIV